MNACPPVKKASRGIVPRGTVHGSIAGYEAWAIHQPQVPIVTRHYFAPGIYAREIIVPADTVITGAYHKTAYLAVLSQGAVSVWREDSDAPTVLMRAPMTIVSPPGARRIGIVHEKMIWTDVFPNPEEDRNIDRIMDRLVIWPSAHYIGQAKANECLP